MGQESLRLPKITWKHDRSLEMLWLPKKAVPLDDPDQLRFATFWGTCTLRSGSRKSPAAWRDFMLR